MQKESGYIIVYDWMAEITEHERLFGLIFSLCKANNSLQIDIARSYLCERLHKSDRTINYWVDDMIKEGCIIVDVKRGRGARNTYKLNAQYIARFMPEKMRKDWLENAQRNAQTVACFSGLPLNPSIEYNNPGNKFNDNIINSSFDKAEDDGQNLEEKNKIILFADEEKIDQLDEEAKKLFGEFWKLFAPADKEKCKYRRAMAQWAQMSPAWRVACIRYLEKIGKPAEQNPYFFLQHFAPAFLNEREQYNAWKQGAQLCRVRYDGKQPICSAWMAGLFGLEIIDDHYEKRFER